MKKTISEIAKLSGVSVRTLHYYDEIGLLAPSLVVPETGYRYYDEDSLARLQQILFYRELDFPLKEIGEIMAASDYNKDEALKRQRELLKLKRDRLDKLIGLLDANLKGENEMSFNEFDNTEIEAAKAKYAEEVKARWGGTDAYAQNQKKTAGYSDDDWKRVGDKMDELLKKFASHIGEDPEGSAVQTLVADWQAFITANYYDCTKEILAGLGQMYIADKRFEANMDKFATGTARLVSAAIAVYCHG